jgi:hypothetical protein
MGAFPLTTKEPIYIADVMLKELKCDPETLHCPNDQPGGDRTPPNVGLSYFQSERSSYEYRTQLGGQKLDQVVGRIESFTDRVIPENTVWIFRDYFNFHGSAGAIGARRYLYVDGHVGDFEN